MPAACSWRIPGCAALFLIASAANAQQYTVTELGTLSGSVSQALGINASGQVTGWAETAGNAATDAFLYRNGQMVDLNSQIGSAASLYTLTNGQGINDSGQIVVDGVVKATGQDAAFLLTPSSVPVPSTVWLLLSGLGGLRAMVRERIAA
jgi:probable HAF family extracellular repeat protein